MLKAWTRWVKFVLSNGRNKGKIAQGFDLQRNVLQSTGIHIDAFDVVDFHRLVDTFMAVFATTGPAQALVVNLSPHESTMNSGSPVSFLD